MTQITLTVAGKARQIDTHPGRRLSEVLREYLNLKSVKIGCDAGDCGACTVLIDGAQHCACLTPAMQADGRQIETLETAEASLSQRLQDAFLNHGAAQCGICTPGVMMAAMDLLRAVPEPSEDQVQKSLAGVLCRCTGYRKMITAVMAANSPAPTDGVSANAGASVGQPIRRLDGQPKVDGTEVFGADFVPEGALLVRAIRSPH